MNNKHIQFDWQKRGLCRTTLKFDEVQQKLVPFSVNDFYTQTGRSVSDEVKKMCKRCPVKAECLNHALHHEKYGYWGAQSEKQRKIMREKLGIKYEAPQSDYPWV